MLETKYYKDYGHNYMILQCRQQETFRSYQYRILTSGKIDNILNCSVRHINGSTYYYYDISSRITLESLYRNRIMSFEEVRDILSQIDGICKKLSAYFMEEAALVLSPEHIYYSLTDKKYFGLYYPDYQTAGPNAYKPLVEFLVEHIDTENHKLTEDMYRIYEMSEEEYFCIEDALQILEENAEPMPKILTESLHPIVDTTNREPEITKIDLLDTIENPPELEQAEQTSLKKILFYLIFAVLSILGIMGAAAVRSIYELTQREVIILYGLMAVMGTCLLLCLIGAYMGSRKRQASENVFISKSDEDYPVDKALPSLENVVIRNEDLIMTDHLPVENGGNTIFFDERTVKEYKLYATDKKNKTHIELKQFPCTIGKMAGCVDYVLTDDSISRIHARIDRKEEQIWLTDMNSTNGTYKNGLRLQPQETVEIEPGDEVRFGNLNYCYR